MTLPPRINGTRPRRYLAAAEAPDVSTWIPLGSGDRLYVESHCLLPEALASELESHARAMRLTVATHGLKVSRIDVSPW